MTAPRGVAATQNGTYACVGGDISNRGTERVTRRDLGDNVGTNVGSITTGSGRRLLTRYQSTLIDCHRLDIDETAQRDTPGPRFPPSVASCRRPFRGPGTLRGAGTVAPDARCPRCATGLRFLASRH